MKILGIDPGVAILGWSILDATVKDRPMVRFGCITTPAHVPLTKRLGLIYDELGELFDLHRPTTVALETLFFVKNAKSLAHVGHTRGVVLLLAGQRGAEIFEYAPRQIKLALTGFGGADKRQMQLVVQRMLGLTEPPRPDDAADAVAVALCHLQYSPTFGKSAMTV